MKRNSRIKDPLLFILALIASGVGLMLIFDAGYARSLQAGRGLFAREFLLQGIFLVASVTLAYALSGLRPEKLKRASKWVWLLTFLSLVAVELFGRELNGAKRWLGYGPFVVQPAEFAKLAAILYLAGAFAERKAWPKRIAPRKSFVHWADTVGVPKLQRAMPGIAVMVAAGLIAVEPDLGTAAVVAFTAYTMFFIGGVSRKSLVFAGLVAAIGVVGLIKMEPYRLERITNHAHRWSEGNLDDVGYQTVQAETAMASGGLFGVGIGSGRAKHVLPATTTDFIMATVGEEFGLVGSLVVLGLLMAIVLRLMMLALSAPTPFGMLLLAGMASWIGIQTTVNVMMANGFLPAIGIPLPFISSGGSSLLALWAAVGVSQAALKPVQAKEDAVEARHHRWRHRRTRLSRA